MSDFERAAQYEKTSRPYYTWDTACELIEHVSRLDLPYSIVTACGAKAIAMVAEMQSLGIDPSTLAIARSYIPDLSAAGIQHAYDTGESMQTPDYASASFVERLEAGIGEVNKATGSVEFNGMRFSEEKSGEADVIVVERANRRDKSSDQGNFIADQRWELLPPGERILFCNHTAPAIRTTNPDGQVTMAIVDPSYKTTEPMTMNEWKELQNFPGAVILSGDINNYGAPFCVHTEFMTSKQRKRFAASLEENGIPSESLETIHTVFSTQPEIYRNVMVSFLKLQAESRYAKDNTPEHYDYARHLAKTVLTGKEHPLPQGIEASRMKVKEMLGKLAPVMAYQKWLEQTESAKASD